MLPLNALALTESLQIELSLAFFAFLRLAPIFFFFPGLGETVVPRKIVLVAILALSFAISPAAIEGAVSLAMSRSELFLLMISETAFGLFIGFFIRSIIFQIHITGNIMSAFTSFSQAFNVGGDAAPPITIFLKYAAITVFFSSDLYLYSLILIADMYNLVPVGTFTCLACMSEVATKAVNFTFNEAVVLSSGIASAMFVLYVIYGFINKAMPQFMVTFVGIPFVTWYTLFFLNQQVELLFTVWVERSMEFLYNGLSVDWY